MSNTHPDKRVRLVPLTHTTLGQMRPTQDIDFVLLLAARNQAKIYIKVPEGNVAFADPNYSAESRPNRTKMRISTVDSRKLAEYISMEPRITYSDDDLPETFLDGTVHAEAAYLALGAWHAKDLSVKQYAQLDTFPSGLIPHPNSRLAKQGWLVPGHFASALRLCSAERIAGKSVISKLGTTATIHRELSTSSERIEPKDILIDESVAALVEGPEASSRNDPFRYRDRAPGVYALYCAARDNHAALKAKRITFEKVQAEIAKQLPMLSEDDLPHVTKFIRPRYRRNSGISADKQKKFDNDIVKRPDFIAKYRHASFINETLALVFYVTDQWLDSHTQFKEGKTAKPRGIWDVRENFRKLHFYELELEALILVVCYRQPLPD